MKCDCYYTQEAIKQTYNPLTGGTMPQLHTVGVCWGTKERDECKCGGDKSRCDFYPAKRDPLANALEAINANPTTDALCDAVRLLLECEIKRGGRNR